MNEFSRFKIAQSTITEAGRAASRAGHALGITVMLNGVCPDRVSIWDAEHAAWNRRTEKAISSCVFNVDRVQAEALALTTFQAAFNGVFNPDVI